MAAASLAQQGDWWVEEVSIGKGAVTKIVQSATAPQAAGTILNVFGPYATQADAQAAAANGTPTGAPASSQSGLVPNPVAGALNSLNPLAGLFQKNIWLRVAEVAIGLVLIAIGLNAMLKGKPLQVVTNTAGMAAKVVPV